MDSRERVYRAIQFTGPDRLPFLHNILPGARQRYGPALDELLERFPGDFARTGYEEPGEYSEVAGVGQADAWGAVWLRETDDHKGLPITHPLDDWSKLDSYRVPDPLAVGDWSRVAETLAGQRDKYVRADGDTLFQRMFYLRGYENLMYDLGDDRPEAYHLRDQIVDFMLRKIEKWLEFDVDGFQFRDDWGTQLDLMISPTTWRKFYKPAYARLFSAVRGAGKHVHFHSDGVIRAIIPDLVELGAQVVNPQVRIVGHDWLHDNFGGRVCFQGDIDRQYVMPFGTPDEVRAYVKMEIASLGSFNGGYIGCGELESDVPYENAVAMYETFAGFTY